MILDETINAKDAWLKQVKHHRRRLKGLPRVGFNPNAGNVEYNISMMNKMLGSGEMPSNNPVSGPFGGDASSGASMGESLNNNINDRGFTMIDEIRQYVLELVQAEFETGHILADDYHTFKKLVAEDGYRATKTMYEFYLECRDLGPEGFLETYRNELDFDSNFVLEYEGEEVIEESLTEMTNMEKLRNMYPELAESYDEDGNHEKCEECDTLLNDAGECPRCIHGEEDIDEKLVHKDNKWEVTSEDGSKVLGTHNTKEEAEKQLQAIHINQHDPLNEDTLNEGPFKSRKDIEAAANSADTKELKQANKLIANLGKILASSYKDKTLQFLLDGKWVDYNTFVKECPATTVAAQSKNADLLNADISNFKELATAINTVVRNSDGYLVRRGLEIIKPGLIAFNPARMDLLKIKDGFKAEDIIGKFVTKEEADNANPEETNKEAQEAETQSQPEVEAQPETQAQPEVEAPKGVTDKTIQNTINAAKVFGMKVFGMQAGSVTELKDDQLKNLGVNTNMDKIWVGKDDKTRVTLSQLAAELKKKNIVESLDDEMVYEELGVGETDLEEGLTNDEMQELVQLGKEIGLNTLGDIEDFAKRETEPGESMLDSLRRYRDDLGDDFELKENFDMSPETLVESINEEEIDISWF